MNAEVVRTVATLMVEEEVDTQEEVRDAMTAHVPAREEVQAPINLSQDQSDSQPFPTARK